MTVCKIATDSGLQNNHKQNVGLHNLLNLTDVYRHFAVYSVCPGASNVVLSTHMLSIWPKCLKWDLAVFRWLMGAYFYTFNHKLTLVSGSRSIPWSVLAVFPSSPVLAPPCISPMRMRRVAAAASFFATFLLEASAIGNSLPLSITCMRNLTEGEKNTQMRHSDLSIHD